MSAKCVVCGDKKRDGADLCDACRASFRRQGMSALTTPLFVGIAWAAKRAREKEAKETKEVTRKFKYWSNLACERASMIIALEKELKELKKKGV